jgi:pimeloyl-ACP methyl ester carboxylesterase
VKRPARCALVALLLSAALVSCGWPRAQPASLASSTAAPASRELRFRSGDVELAGQLDLPPGAAPFPLVVVVHHAGPATREAYGYLATRLLERGYAVFLFDKRGNGASGGVYGCCEAEDALAAYRAAVVQPDIDRANVFVAAQSRGTEHVAGQFDSFARAQEPRGVVLMSNLLGPERIGAVATAVLVMVADSEPALQSIGPEAAAAHAAAHSGRTELYIARHAEHNLFDISAGPIDWDDPQWAERYHRGAMAALLDWLDQQRRSGKLPRLHESHVPAACFLAPV